MKAVTLLLVLFTTGLSSTGHTQFRTLNTDQLNSQVSQISLHLSTDEFATRVFLPDFTPDTQPKFSVLEKKATQISLLFGVSLLGNKFDFDFRPAGLDTYPVSVTEYNNVLRRQMFEAVPTSQKRRSTAIIRFN
jgi:hypothetical protein